jgi:F-type H+-transporting ATPase subunit epsilon
VLIDQAVTKIVADGRQGSFCLLPRHIDFLAALVPGLLSFTNDAGEEEFVAVDEGILVKQGEEVFVSTRQAFRGGDLEQVQTSLQRELAASDEQERAANAAVAKLEAGFLRDYLEFAEEQA